MPARIILCGMPRLLMDVVSAIFAEEDNMSVAARLDGATDLTSSVRDLQPDIVVLQEGDAPGRANHTALFEVRTGLTVVAITGLGSGGTVYRLNTQPEILRQPSVAQLIRAVRGKPRLRA